MLKERDERGHHIVANEVDLNNAVLITEVFDVIEALRQPAVSVEQAIMIIARVRRLRAVPSRREQEKK